MKPSKNDRQFDRQPKTQGETRAEHVARVITQQPIVRAKPPRRIDVTINGTQLGHWGGKKSQLTPTKIASVYQVPPQVVIGVQMAQAQASMAQALSSLSLQSVTVRQMMQSFCRAVGFDPDWLDDMHAAERFRELVRVGYQITMPATWVCQAIGFEPHELKHVEVWIDWEQFAFVADVDLNDTDWEPTYVVPFHEVYRGWVPNPLHRRLSVEAHLGWSGLILRPNLP